MKPPGHTAAEAFLLPPSGEWFIIEARISRSFTDMNELKETLRKLHAQLGTAEGVDDELKELLTKLDQDIHGLLQATPAAGEQESLTERAQEVAARFASEHPQMEKLLRELADKLANIGI
jgi:chromosome segregation ATPase